MENQYQPTPQINPNTPDISLPLPKKNFFQKLTRSQKISLVSLAFVLISLPVATVLSLVATRINSRAYLPPATTPVQPTPTKCINPVQNIIPKTNCYQPTLPSKDSQGRILPSISAPASSSGYLAATITCSNGYTENYLSSKCLNKDALSQIAQSICGQHASCTTPTTSSDISCRFEVFAANSETQNPYSYSSLLDQNTTRIKPDEYYLYGLLVFNNSKTVTLTNLNVKVTQLHQQTEPIEIVNSDQNCVIDNVNKTVSCSILNNLEPASSTLVSAGHVVRILPGTSDPKTSSMFTVSSNLGTTTCANMLFYSTPPTPSVCLNPVKSVKGTNPCDRKSTGYMSATVVCLNGYTENYRAPRCISSKQLAQIAQSICNQHASCTTPTR